VSTSFDLQRSIVIAELGDLLEINRQKKFDRPKYLVLVHVAKFMTQQPWIDVMTRACKYCVSEGKPDHSRAKETRLNCNAAKFWIFRKGQPIYNLYANQFRSSDADCSREGLSLRAKRLSKLKDVLFLNLRPGDCTREKARQQRCEIKAHIFLCLKLQVTHRGLDSCYAFFTPATADRSISFLLR
jgi:hypothetical protein